MAMTPASFAYECDQYVNTTEEERQQIALTHAQLLQRNMDLKAQLAAMALYSETAAAANARAHMLFFGLRAESYVAPNSTQQPRQISSRNQGGANLISRYSKETLPKLNQYDDVSTIASSGGYNSEADDVSIVSQTTVILRKIPTSYTRADIVELIDQQGFGGLYDLVYAPIDFLTELNHGYAFVNFTMTEDAVRFQEYFEGFTKWKLTSDNVCEAVWSESSRCIDDHIQRYRDSPVMHKSVPDHFKPILFAGGKRIPFPEPTKKIRAPRIRVSRKGFENMDCTSC